MNARIPILAILKEHGEVSPVEICQIIPKDKAVITRVVQSLEEEKLVKRTVNPDDKRSIRLALTTKGEKVAEKITLTTDEIHRMIAKHLTDKEVKEVLKAMSKIYEICQKVRESESLNS